MVDKKVFILFSGGQDSTSVAVHFLKQGYFAHLITFDNGAERWLNLSEYKGKSIEKQFPGHCIHKILDCKPFFKELAIRPLEEDMKKYGYLVCCGCKLAMLTEAILYCKKNGIIEIADGFKQEQDYYPEQTPEYMDLADDFARQYGITPLHPLYGPDGPDPADFADGGSFPVPPLQAACLFGENPILNKEFIEPYVRSKLPAMHEYIRAALSSTE